MAWREPYGKMSSPYDTHGHKINCRTHDAIGQQVGLCKQKDEDCTTQTHFKDNDVLFTAVTL